MSNQQLGDFLAHSVELESEARERYLELAESMTEHHNTEVADFFGRMAEESRLHLEEVAQIAEGKADIYPRLGPTMEWDTAAGHAIVNAVGKKVWLTDFSVELSYNKRNLLNSWFIVR